MGAWIEITAGPDGAYIYHTSHPLWVRGLKLGIRDASMKIGEVAPFMGAWIEIPVTRAHLKAEEVAPFMGAWIEIQKKFSLKIKLFCRTLYGCVD